MGDIEDALPKETKTVQAIYDHYKAQGDNGYMSQTLSVSLLGHPCERYLWYSFRQCFKPQFDGRMYRLFERGDLEEARLTTDLRAIGCEVHVIDERTGRQFLVLGHGGHLKGYMDGCGLGLPEAPKTWHVVEYKTHNAKSFAKLRRDGLEKAHPKHFAQVQIEMHLTGMRRALYLAVNKDTDEIYAERVRYDKAFATDLYEKALRIIALSKPPSRISSRPDYYQCRFCDAKAICWGTTAPEPAVPLPRLSCRQCCWATPLTDRGNAHWRCEKHGNVMRLVGDVSPCKHHLLIPDLVMFAEVGAYDTDDLGNARVEFIVEDGKTFRHGNGPGCISSEALITTPADAIMDGAVQAACEQFGAKPTDYCADDILSRYPEEDSRTIWKGPAKQIKEQWMATYKEDPMELKPLATCNNFEARVIEYEGGRLAIVWRDSGLGEIREGVE